MDQWIAIQDSLAFFALMMAFISFWLKRSPWMWGAFLIIAGLLGFYAKLLDPIALAPIGALFILHGLLRGGVQGWTRFALAIVTIGISIGLWTHLFPGFHPLLVVDQVEISKGAVPFSLYMSFDKPLVGFFILAWSLPLIQNLFSFKQMLKVALPLSLLGIILLAAISLYSGLITWDPKFPTFFWLFAPINLILVVIPEEAFMRGFVQNECYRLLGGKGIVAQVFAVLLTALFFAALHYTWVKNIPFLALVFIAGVIYGAIYQLTKSIEASITCHFLFNIVHFTLFTYPVLKSAFLH